MDYTMLFCFLATTIALSSVTMATEEIPVFAVIGDTIKLHCDLPMSESPNIEWVDRVFGSDDNPAKIFTSQNNPQFAIKESHDNRENYRVNRNFTLTIMHVDVDQDVGQYTCRSKVGSEVHKRHYYLTIGELPKCSGNGHLRAGDRTTLTCEMSYAGNQPMLDWYENNDKETSIDEYDIRMAKKVIEVHATHRQDGSVFRCVMTLGRTEHECNISMNVTYAVHEPKFHPHRDQFIPGDEVKCVAKGNPTPEVTLTPEFPSATSGPGWAAVIVEQSWVGKTMAVQCSATNVLDGVEHLKSSNFSFLVSVPTKPTKAVPHEHSTGQADHMPKDKENQNMQPASTESGHHDHDHHHHNHNDHAPSKHDKDLESVETEKPVQRPKPNPDLEAVRSNSAGTRVTFMITTTLLSLMAAMRI